MTRPRTVRLVAAAVASALLVAGAVGIATLRGADAPVAAAPSPGAGSGAGPTPSAAPSVAPSPVTAVPALLTDPDAAEAAGASAVMAAGKEVARGPWRRLGDPAWPLDDERPVYVGTASIADDLSRVTVDLVLATRVPDPADDLVLRLLSAAEALGADAAPTVDVRVDGAPASATVDRDGARLDVTLPDGAAAGDPVLLRVALSYPLVPAAQITDDGGPAGFGLLARYPDLATLGHWLPLLTFDGGPMLPWGDVGAFPVAVWSLQVTHGGTLVTGGAEADCPDATGRQRACTWARGTGLRDVSAVIYRERVTPAETDRRGVHLRAYAAAGVVPADALDVALGEAADATESYERRFGPLAWPDVDVAATPLGTGAAGMEFPGLVMIGSDLYDQLGGGFGTFAVVHEIAHQWFHALVGNSSLSDPVVDESLAQYCSYLYWSDRYGAAAAEQLADTAFVGRYRRSHAEGVEDEPPAQPLADFGDADTYNAMVYARAPLAFVEAQRELGEGAVVGFLADEVRRHGLGVVTDDAFVREAEAADPSLGEVLRRYWLDPAPIEVPEPSATG